MGLRANDLFFCFLFFLPGGFSLFLYDYEFSMYEIPKSFLLSHIGENEEMSFDDVDDIP